MDIEGEGLCDYCVVVVWVLEWVVVGEVILFDCLVVDVGVNLVGLVLFVVVWGLIMLVVGEFVM